MADNKRTDFESELTELIRRMESDPRRFDCLVDDVAHLVKGDHAWDTDPGSPASKLIVASLAAADEVDQEVIPHQGPALQRLHEAISEIHPAVVEEIFNDIQLGGRFDPESLATKDWILDRIKEPLDASGKGHHRPPKDREPATRANG